MTWFHLNLEAFSFALLSILFEGIPFLLLGSLISGLVDVFVSSERVSKLLPKNPVSSVFLAGFMGMIFPICECGSVVVVRRFVRKGLPVGSAIAYMLAAPIVSPIVAISTYKAFSIGNVGGVEMSPLVMVLLRMGLGFAVAVIVALVVQRLPLHRILQPALLDPTSEKKRTGLRITGGEDTPDFATLVAQASPKRKLLLAVQSAAADFLDVAFYFVIGASLASLFVGFKEAAIMPLATSPFLSIITLMGLASILCLCSTTDAFVAANAFAKFSVAANLGFLVFGPMFDLKLFWLYGMIFKRRFVFVLGAGLFVLVAFLCWQVGTVDAWNPHKAVTPPPLETPKTALPSNP
jgi:uncharacterized membrane protein YraQ (UPF0718 family)